MKGPETGGAPLRLYAALLWLCPPRFRRRWAARMCETLRQRAAEEAGGTLVERARFWLPEYADSVRTALREWTRSEIAPRGTPRGLAGDLRSDLRQALRGLARRPVLTAVAIATAALGIGAAVVQFLFEWQVLESAFLPALGESDDGVVAVEGEAAGIAGTERHLFKLAGLAVDETEPTRAGIEQPQAAVVQPWRMRH